MSPCQSCHAGCCRSFAVPVSGADVLRIDRDLGLSFWEFACRWADPDGKIARSYAPHFHFADQPGTPFVICLMHEESGVHPGTTKCRFLAESPPDAQHPLGMAHCGIYASRPSACRVFPTRLNDTGDLIVLYDVPPRARGTDEPAYTLCPRAWEISDVDPIDAAQDLAVARFEMNFFMHVASVWNRAPAPWEMFPEFLHLVYKNRIIRDMADEADEAQPRILPFPTAQRQAGTRAA